MVSNWNHCFGKVYNFNTKYEPIDKVVCRCCRGYSLSFIEQIKMFVGMAGGLVLR